MEINYKKAQLKFTPVTLTLTFTTAQEWSAWQSLLKERTSFTSHWELDPDKEAADAILARLYLDLIQNNVG